VDKRLWVNAGLLVFIVLLSSVLLMPDDNTEQELPRLSNIEPNDIVNIEVLRKNLDDFEFNKQDEIWHMRSPLKFLANNARTNAMLHILKSESHAQLNPAEVDLARFDLVDPIITLKLNDHVFQFGNTDAIDTRRYVLFDGKIHLVNDSLYAQLTTNAAFFADPKILPLDIDINAIQFPDNKIELIDENWQTQTLMDINPDQLKRIVFNWNNAVAISVRKYAAPETELPIIVSSSSGITIRFIVVSTEPHLILGRKDIGIQYHLGSDETDKLLLKENSETTMETQQQ
jgi:Domain of unknown function (DUF4340)